MNCSIFEIICQDIIHQIFKEYGNKLIPFMRSFSSSLGCTKYHTEFCAIFFFFFISTKKKTGIIGSVILSFLSCPLQLNGKLSRLHEVDCISISCFATIDQNNNNQIISIININPMNGKNGACVRRLPEGNKQHKLFLQTESTQSLSVSQKHSFYLRGNTQTLSLRRAPKAFP